MDEGKTNVSRDIIKKQTNKQTNNKTACFSNSSFLRGGVVVVVFFLFFSLDFFSLKKNQTNYYSFASFLQSNQSSLFPFPLLTIMYILRRIKQRSASRNHTNCIHFRRAKARFVCAKRPRRTQSVASTRFLRTKRFARTSN